MPDATAEAEAVDYADPSPERRAKAEKFWDRARKVAEASQWDYAIEMYLSGLEFAPNDVAVHAELRKIALTRKATGGKALGSFKAMGLKKKGKDELKNFLNARKLLAYDPGNVAFMEQVAATAAAAELNEIVAWMGPMVYRALLDQPKRQADPFIRLKDIFKRAREFDLAQKALEQAVALRPDDSDLQHEMRDLATQEAIKRGSYEKGDFKQSIRDAEGQKALLDADADVRTVDALKQRMLAARAEYERDPVPGKLAQLVETLTKTGELKYENEALELLEKAHADTNSYRWKFAAEEIQIRQFNRAGRMLKTALDADPTDAATKKEWEQHRRDQLKTELTHFRGAMQAYPTENRWKYETGRRLYELGEFTDAIPLLQQSQGDAKFRDDARLLLGRAFLAAEFPDEAAETLRNLIESYQIDADDKAKLMHYWYGRSLEAKGDEEEALKAYSQIAQWDFAYRDVQARIKALRKK